MKHFKKAARQRQQADWTPFERAVWDVRQLREQQQRFGMTDAQMAVMFEGEVWMNNHYTVHLREFPAQGDGAYTVVWLSIKRIDRQSIHDWRAFQRIKNELVGPECEAIELYPAESRKVDTANQYHLFCVKDAQFRFPFGFNERLVMEEPGGGAGQRPGATSY